MAETTYKFPKTMGACADLVYKLREERLAAAKVVAGIEEHEKALKKHIIDNLPKSETTGVAGKLARVTVVTKNIPQVKDWDALYKYITRTKSFDLLQRRLSDTAVNARWDNNKVVPGVESFTTVSLSINKV